MSEEFEDKKIKSLISEARKKASLPDKEPTDLLRVLKAEIPIYIKKMKPTDFYQWFCPVWQTYQYMYDTSGQTDPSYTINEKEWSRLVGVFASSLIERENENVKFEHENLRAMCMSFMMNSLGNHPNALAYALRMLLVYAIRSDMTQNVDFIHWLLKFMQRHIDNTVSIKENRDIFIESCVEFFAAIPEKHFDSLCSISILKFYKNPMFKQSLQGSKKNNENLKNVATKVFNVTLNDDSFFVFEIMSETELITKNLSQLQMDLLNIYINGGVKQYNDFVKANQSFVAQNKLNTDRMYFKIQALSLFSLVENKTEIDFEEVTNALQISVPNVKRLIISLNSTGVATIKIDSVAKKLFIQQAPTRLFEDKKWKEMSQFISSLITSLKNISKSSE